MADPQPLSLAVSTAVLTHREPLKPLPFTRLSANLGRHSPLAAPGPQSDIDILPDPQNNYVSTTHPPHFGHPRVLPDSMPLVRLDDPLTDPPGEWAFPLCVEPYNDTETCCIGCWCPCLLYGRTQTRLKKMAESKDPPDDFNYKECNGPCWAFFFTCLLGFSSCVPLFLQHTRIRATYAIDGTKGGDCVQSVFCQCCTLMQDEREIRAREQGVAEVRTAMNREKQPPINIPQQQQPERHTEEMQYVARTPSESDEEDRHTPSNDTKNKKCEKCQNHDLQEQPAERADKGKAPAPPEVEDENRTSPSNASSREGLGGPRPRKPFDPQFPNGYFEGNVLKFIKKTKERARRLVWAFRETIPPYSDRQEALLIAAAVDQRRSSAPEPRDVHRQAHHEPTAAQISEERDDHANARVGSREAAPPHEVIEWDNRSVTVVGSPRKDHPGVRVIYRAPASHLTVEQWDNDSTPIGTPKEEYERRAAEPHGSHHESNSREVPRITLQGPSEDNIEESADQHHLPERQQIEPSPDPMAHDAPPLQHSLDECVNIIGPARVEHASQVEPPSEREFVDEVVQGHALGEDPSDFILPPEDSSTLKSSQDSNKYDRNSEKLKKPSLEDDRDLGYFGRHHGVAAPHTQGNGSHRIPGSQDDLQMAQRKGSSSSSSGRSASAPPRSNKQTDGPNENTPMPASPPRLENDPPVSSVTGRQNPTSKAEESLRHVLATAVLAPETIPIPPGSPSMVPRSAVRNNRNTFSTARNNRKRGRRGGRNRNKNRAGQAAPTPAESALRDELIRDS